jgi:hypothetical protein
VRIGFCEEIKEDRQEKNVKTAGCKSDLCIFDHMLIKLLFYAFLIYLAFKLVFNLIIPVYRTTKKVKRGFREMQEKMEQQASRYHQQQSYQENAKQQTTPARHGDYIEFEEIK